VLADAGPPRVLVARGRIRERGTRDPVADADVMVQRAGQASAERIGASDPEGYFTVEAPPGERVRLIVAGGEHEPCIQDLQLPGPGQPPLELACWCRAGGRPTRPSSRRRRPARRSPAIRSHSPS
jgi:hypothetical protein